MKAKIFGGLLALIVIMSVAVFWGIKKFNHSASKSDVGLSSPLPENSLQIAAPNSAQNVSAPAAVPPSALGAAGFSGVDQSTVTALVGKFNTGDYLGAVTLADVAAINPQLSAEFQKWLREQMPAVLVSAGWIKIKLGDCDEGIRFLTRAEGFKKNPEASKGLAFCHQKLGNVAAADEQFQSYLEQAPQDAEMLLLYSDTLESQNRFAESVQTLESALTYSHPDNKSLIDQKLSAMRLRSKESRSQSSDSSRNFIISYRSGEHEDLAGIVMETLEQALDEFVEDYGYKEPPTRLEVVLYPFDQFRGIVVGGPEWAEGVFDGRLRIPVKSAEVRARDYLFLKTVLRHELIHALNALMSGGRALPPWFEEGLAQRLSCPRSGCSKFQFPPTPGKFLPPASFSAPYITLDAVAAGQAYRQSLYMIYTIEQLKAGDDILRSLVRNLSASGTLDSDTLLIPSGMTFTALHDTASNWWSRRLLK